MADFMNTYTGKHFSVIHPDKDSIDVVDIAHALSMLCRGNGHVKHFYSVGQHCINCAKLAKARGYSREVQFACLLHDASEAYMADVIRPIKKDLPYYQEIEHKLLHVIFEKYGILEYLEDTRVKAIDDALCHYDLRNLMNVDIEVECLEYIPDISYKHPMEVEKEYLEVFDELKGSCL